MGVVAVDVIQPPLQMKMCPMETFADERFIILIILCLVTYANFLPHSLTFSPDVVATGDHMERSIIFLKRWIFLGLNFVVNATQHNISSLSETF